MTEETSEPNESAEVTPPSPPLAALSLEQELVLVSELVSVPLMLFRTLKKMECTEWFSRIFVGNYIVFNT